MGAGGVPNRTIIRVDGRHGDLPTISVKPNSRYDLYINGKKVQSRWYDDKCRVIRNRDYYHQDAHNNHTFPHDHIWTWERGYAKRIPENLEPDYENYV